MVYVSASTGQQIQAVLFDTFGTVVDWRSGVARDISAFAERHRIVDLDAAAFADAWRAKYEPSMEPIRNGTRSFVPLDELHREIDRGGAPADRGTLLDGDEAFKRIRTQNAGRKTAR